MIVLGILGSIFYESKDDASNHLRGQFEKEIQSRLFRLLKGATVSLRSFGVFARLVTFRDNLPLLTLLSFVEWICRGKSHNNDGSCYARLFYLALEFLGWGNLCSNHFIIVFRRDMITFEVFYRRKLYVAQMQSFVLGLFGFISDCLSVHVWTT